MITTKQRAFLRSLSHNLAIAEHIGQNGITDAVLDQIANALFSKELVKIKVLPNCELSTKEAMEILCEKLLCEGVQCIGRTLVIYKKSNKKGVAHIIN